MEQKCKTMEDLFDEMNAELKREFPNVGESLSTTRAYTPQWLSDVIEFTTRNSINLIEDDELISPSCPTHSINISLGR